MGGELIALREYQRNTGGHAPSRRQLTLDADIEEVVEIVDLVSVDLTLLLLDDPDKMPERLLVPVAQRDRPFFRIGTFLDTAGRFREHTKPGCASSGGDSTLAGGRPGGEGHECGAESKRDP